MEKMEEKIFFFFFFFLQLGGLTLIICSLIALVQNDRNPLADFKIDVVNFKNVWIMLIVAGVFILAISAVGYWGAIEENKCVLIIVSMLEVSSFHFQSLFSLSPSTGPL